MTSTQCKLLIMVIKEPDWSAMAEDGLDPDYIAHERDRWHKSQKAEESRQLAKVNSCS